MPRPSHLLAPCLLLAAVAGSPPSRAADLPFSGEPVAPHAAYGRGLGGGGGGFRVAGVPVRPVPVRYDVYGYPLFPGAPSPPAVGNGCPPALQPTFDSEGNLAGYAPIPMCR